MNEIEIGRFYAISHGGRVHEFIVREDRSIYSSEYPNIRFNKMIIKPNFVLYGKNQKGEEVYVCPTEGRNDYPLIKKFVIDDNLFDALYLSGTICYSTDMAYLYDLKYKTGYDSCYHEGRPFKWAEKKGKVLQKWKQGIYN